MINMQYQGDLSPIELATGTALVSSNSVTLTPAVKVPIGRLAKAMFYADVYTGTAATGNIVVTYGYQVGEFLTATTTATITLSTIVAGHYKGVVGVSSTDYGTLYVTSIQNNMNKDLTSYDFGVTGMIMY